MITRYDLKFMNKEQLENVKNETLEEMKYTEKWTADKTKTNTDAIEVQERMIIGLKEDLKIINEWLLKIN